MSEAPANGMLGFAISVDGVTLQVSAVDANDGVPRLVRSYAMSELGAPAAGRAVADPLGRFVILGPSYSDQPLTPTAFAISPGGEVLADTAVASAAGIEFRGLQIVPSGRFAYAPTPDGQLRGYAVSATGRLQELAGSPFGPTAPGGSFFLHLQAGGQLLFLDRVLGTNTDASQPAAVFRADPDTGVVQPVVRSPAPAPDEKGGVVPVGTGHALVQKQDGSWRLHAVDAETGQLTPLTPAVSISGSVNPTSRFVDPAGKLIVIDRTVYAFDPARIAIGSIGNLASLDIAGTAIVMDNPFVGDFIIGLDTIWRVNGGTSVDVAGRAPLATVSAILPPAPASTWRAMTFAIDASASRVRSLRTNTDGTLTETSSVAVPGVPVVINEQPGRGVLTVVSSNGSGAGSVTLFRLDRDTGALAAVATTDTGPAPTGATAAADQLYVSHFSGIDVFDVDAAAGTLQKRAGSPYPVGYGPIQLDANGAALPEQPVTDRTAADVVFGNGILYVATNQGTTGEISTLSASTMTGIHAGIDTCPNEVPSHPRMGSTFFPSGNGTVRLAQMGARYVYAINRTSDSLAAYQAIGGTCWYGLGAWMPALAGSPYATGPRPVDLAIDPQQRFMFVANSGGSGSVTAYNIDQPMPQRLNGSPSPLPRVPAHAWIDATGNYLYTSDSAGTVTVQVIDRQTGSLGSAQAAFGGGAYRAISLALPAN